MMTTTYQILYWFDIPVQVRAGGRRDRVSRELSPRFAEAVDHAAMKAKLIGTDDYLAMFAWGDPQTREGSAQVVVDEVVAELEAQFLEIDWQASAEKLLAQRAI